MPVTVRTSWSLGGVLAGLLVLPCAAGVGVPADDAAGDWRRGDLHEEVPVKTGARIVVENAWGDVRLRTLQDEHVAVFGSLQAGPGQALPSVGLHDAEPALLRVRVQSGAARPSVVRADLAVFVPRGCPVEIRTTHGRIFLKGVAAPVVMTSETGDLQLKTRGPVEATTERGNIEALLETGDWQGPINLRARQGNIQAGLGRAPRGRVHVHTAGRITSDFSMQVTHAAGGGPKHAVLHFGRAPRAWWGWWRDPLPEVQLHSELGDVAVLRTFTEMMEATADAP